MIKLKPGDRVRVRGHWNWPKDCVATLSFPPAFAQLIAKPPWRGLIRTIRGRDAIIPFVWVNFDEPQRDGDGDGPYPAGEVELEFVTRVDHPSG